ncbi:MAG: Rne/Rng family ribonuclease [Bacteroidetes bacterium]|nr:Rne/Rng family ribonuclease [Bacteroidota bacterium]MCL5737984.1 Rne/Rng family ribonuclease [Bacteroidota bacterium]
MKKEIVINETADQIRIAITEDGRLAEIFVESPGKERMVGDIYLGRIARVMPGIRAAFIDVGQKQDAFLHFSDVDPNIDDYSSLIGEEDSEIDDEEDEEAETSTPASADHPSHPQNGPRPQAAPRAPRPAQREVHLERDQSIIVQVTKEPVGKKGVRVTSKVSLPGRYLVLLPFDGRIGVSKKLYNFREKKRLRRIVRSMLPEGFGVIIRTVAEGKEEELLKNDIEQLIKTWREIEKSLKTEQPPILLYKDLSTVSSVIRDLFNNEVQRVVVDSRRLYKEITTYVKWFAPLLVDKIEYYRGKQPIFDVFGVAKDMQESLGRRVSLKTGGYLVIDVTEAMTVIDVNSGRYAASKEQEQNSLRTNMEASREIIRQLRLRDIGGIIVIDFIDLEDERNKRKVYEELRKEFRKDRAKVTVLPMTEFGLVQITRQRIRQSIMQSFSETCPVCAGTGIVQSRATVFTEITGWLSRFKAEGKGFSIKLTVHPYLASYLKEGKPSHLFKLMWKNKIFIKLDSNPAVPVSSFKVYSSSQKRDVTEDFKG